MLVYADPCQCEALHAMAQRIARALGQGDGAADARLQGLRSALIAAGQIEQALLDTAEAGSSAEARHEAALASVLTRQLAQAFVACWGSVHDSRLLPVGPDEEALRAALAAVVALSDRRLRMKVPEGFAFYALYPEHSIEAALRWAAERAPAGQSGRVLVVGLRSIGTTLGATVAAVLEALGWGVLSTSVRPHGHPFAREVALAAEWGARVQHALIVDEGPGLSGSSMAAAARAIEALGVAPQAIAFMPGHSGSPGHVAREEVRARWQVTPRYVVGAAHVRIGAGTLASTLAASAAAWMGGGDDPVVRVDDLSAGRWRELHYPSRAHWPAVCSGFERPKYVLTTARGRRLLAKFAGLSPAPDHAGSLCDAERAVIDARSATGWTVPALGSAHGFVFVPWLQARPQTHADGDAAMLHAVGRYLAEARGMPLAACEGREARERLWEMLRVDLREAFEAEDAKRIERCAHDALRATPEADASYGDGHLAPHEWLSCAEGRRLKVDCTGHTLDHTLVGRQAWWWDLAGACVEWRIRGPRLATLVRACVEAGGEPVPAPALLFYRLAYAAFRMGQFTIAAQSAADGEERARLESEASRMRDALRAML